MLKDIRISYYTLYPLPQRNGDISCNSVLFVPILGYSVIYTALYTEVLTSESRCCHSNCRHFNSSWGKPHRPHNHCHRCCHGWTLGICPVGTILYIYFSMFLLFSVPLSTFLPHPSKNHPSLFWNFYRGIL